MIVVRSRSETTLTHVNRCSSQLTCISTNPVRPEVKDMVTLHECQQDPDRRWHWPI